MSAPVVLHVFESWSPMVTGYVTRSRRIVEHQRDQGIAVPHVLVSSRQHALAGGRATPLPGVPPITVAAPSRREELIRRVRPYDLDEGNMARAVAQAAREAGARIVHGHFSSAIGRGALAGARAAGLPFVSEVRFDLAGAMADASGNPLIKRAEPFFRRRFEGHHARADAVVAASHALARLVRRLAPGVPVHVAPNGADPCVDPEAVRRAGAALRRRYGLEDHVVVGTATNMLGYEGLHRLAPILAQVPGSALLMVGDGARRAELTAQAEALGVRAVFPGVVPADEVPAHIAALDVFAIPRPPATITAFASPLKLAEAMAVGAAVVATDQGDIAHMLRDDHGLVVAPDDDAALAAALRRLCSDPDLRARLRALTRARAAHEMTWADAVRPYRDAYADVLG